MGVFPIRCQRAVNRATWFVVEEGAGWFIVARVAVAESVGEDLVDDGVLDPVGGLEVRGVKRSADKNNPDLSSNGCPQPIVRAASSS
jgi:hypothetical protein